MTLADWARRRRDEELANARYAKKVAAPPRIVAMFVRQARYTNRGLVRELRIDRELATARLIRHAQARAAFLLARGAA